MIITNIAWRGVLGTELARICHNLNIEPRVFVKEAVIEKLERMGIVVK